MIVHLKKQANQPNISLYLKKKQHFIELLVTL